jgi:murein DD-endopeptidase MepM/ murein hydrolase activator NlpD
VNTRLAVTLVVAAVAVPLCCAIPLAVIGAAVSTCADGGHQAAARPDQHGVWDREQTKNAATIVTVGAAMQVPRRGWVIAVATAMQESGLRNLDHRGQTNDHDSLGLFQQRPSQGWGTREQILDPRHAATAFYHKLLTIPGWQLLPLTEAAQQVQRSAYPDAYAQWETAATDIVNHIAAGPGQPTTTALDQCADTCLPAAGGPESQPPPPAEGATCEWVAPVHAPIVSGFRTTARPSHDGVDLGAARGTPIRAASAGTVIVARCNVTPATHGCDQDGSPSIRGCGWYADLRHQASTTTRYCHMSTRPAVTDGQTVTTGQVLGIVGSSGNSSGPHLHFEVHIAGTPVDPVTFMATRAPIGQPA